MRELTTKEMQTVSGGLIDDGILGFLAVVGTSLAALLVGGVSGGISAWSNASAWLASAIAGWQGGQRPPM